MNESQALQTGGRILQQAIRREIRAQGHSLTGSLENSLAHHAITDGRTTRLTGTMRHYGAILNLGVTGRRIPYQPGSGKTHSRYIDALVGYFIQRGLEAKEAKRAAFATAIKQKKEGMPTASSARFSRTGKRTDFLGDVQRATMPRVNQAVMAALDTMVQQEYNRTKSETI